MPSLIQPTVTVLELNGVVSTGAGGMAAPQAAEVLEINRSIYSIDFYSPFPSFVQGLRLGFGFGFGTC